MTDKKQNSQEPINRRDMLKKGALAAGGAITAAAFLDGKWLKPIVKTGILPVHAQASACGIYTFSLFFQWLAIGTNYRIVVDISPIGPIGPISYEIMGVNGSFITPGVGSTGSTTYNGSAKAFPDEIYTFGIVQVGDTITIRWSYEGCDYTQTYGEEDLP